MSIPEGFKLVPVEPTENMVIDGFESAPSECFTDYKVWDEYQQMSGCQQAAFRAKLCWAAMLAAAPTPPQPIYDEAVNAAVLGAQNLNAAMATIDILRAQLAERDALLTDLGVEPDGVSDVYQRLLLNAERYEYLREHMAVENFPSEHPDWSQPSEYESRRIDELCDSAMSRAKAGEDE